jgi:very-short-patch-repair endonuclease
MMFHVVMTRASLAASGKSPWQIERSIRRGEVERAYPGKFVVPGTDPKGKWDQDLAVLMHRCGLTAVASHRTAARFHALDGDWHEPLDVLVGLNSGVRHPNVMRTKTLETQQIVSAMNGVNITSVARTLVDLGRFVSADVLEMAFESALRGDPKNPHEWKTELLAELEAWPTTLRIIGHGVLREVLRRRAPGAIPTASAAETLMLQILRTIALDRLVLRQPLVHLIASDGRRIRGYPDFLFWEIALAIEVDGKRWHTEENAVVRDNRRENLLGAGLRILRYTGTEVRNNGPAIAAEILAEYRTLIRRGLPPTVRAEKVDSLTYRYHVA